MVYSYNYRPVKSQNQISFNNFSGEINFEFQTDQLEYCDLLDTYMAVDLRVEQRSSSAVGDPITCLRPISVPPNAAPTNSDFIPFISKNHLACLFTNGKKMLNDKVINTINEIPSVNTLIRSVFDTDIINKTIESTNTINPLGIEDVIQSAANQTFGQTYTALGVLNRIDYSTVCPYSGHNKYAWDNMGQFKYYIENACNMTLPFSLFTFAGLNPEGIPPGNKIKFSFMVDPNFATNIVQYTQSLGPLVNIGAVNLGIANIVKLTAENACPVNSIAVGVKDITLYVRSVMKTNPVNEVKLLHVRQIYAQTHTIQSAYETFPLSVPGNNIKYILACFLQTSRYGPGKTPTDFSDGFIPAGAAVTTTLPANPNTFEVSVPGGACKNLQFVRFMYHRASYPSVDYNINNVNISLCSSNNTNGSTANSLELSRLFQDVIGNNLSREDRCGAIYNLSRLAVEPIFCYKMADYPNSSDNNMTITVKLQSNINPGIPVNSIGADAAHQVLNTGYVQGQSTLLVVCLYDDVFEIVYDTNGQVVDSVLRE